MNKLVSRNPVQRFKEGKKIVKAQYSWGPGFGLGNTAKNQELKEVRKQKNIDTAIDNLLKTVKNPTPSQQASFNRNPVIGDAFKNDLDNLDFSPYGANKIIRYPHSALVSDFHNNGYYASENARNILTNNRFLVEKVNDPIPFDSKRSYSAEKSNTDLNLKEKDLQKKIIQKEQQKSFKTGTKKGSNRIISIYDKDGVWASNASAERLTNRDQVKAFQQKLGLEGDAVDGIWGKNTQKAYDDWKLKQKVTFKTPSIEENAGPILSTPTIPQSEYTFIESQLQGLGDNPYFEPHSELRQFDRTQVRDFLRKNNINPYSMTGAQRKALRMIMNGQGTEQDKNLIGLTEGLTELLTKYNYLKKGGNLLPLRNIVQRFKQRNFRIVEQ